MIVEEKIPQIKEKFNAFTKDLHLSMLSEGRPIYLNAQGMSMYPFIKSGDRIKIELVDEEEIKPGDIIAIERKDKTGPWFFVHRVVKIVNEDGKNFYFTKGDIHKKGLEGPITQELIAGKITQIQRANLEIDLRLPLWRYLNKIIAKISLDYPALLNLLCPYISLAIEWRLFLSKVKNRFKKGNPLVYNAEELLLVCARKDLDARLKNKAIRLVKEGLDWHYFTPLAMRQGVTILIFNALKAISPYVRIPQFVLERLKSAYLFIASKITFQHHQLLEVLKLFAKKDIPVIPLKGTLLSKRLYKDISSRGLSVDFDLLIKEKDKEEAKALLEGLGYTFKVPDEIKAWQWFYVFYKPKAKPIELHWDITMMVRSQERIEGLWQGTELVDWEGVKFYDFQSEELLIYLSAHLVNSDSFRTLRAICDICRLLEKYSCEINWPRLIKKAKDWRVCGSLYAALKLSKDLFGFKLPKEALSQLRIPLPKRLFIQFFAHKKVILKGGLRRKILDEFLSYTLFELAEAISFKDYLAILKRVCFPPKEAIGNKSYILRIFKGIAKLFKQVPPYKRPL